MERKQRNAYDPELMAAVRDEEQYVNDTQHGKRQVKLERGQIWMVRFLPAMLGENKRWFARIARHWLNKKPIICPVHTSADYGGDKGAYCPCCEVCDRLNASGDETISKFGYRAMGNPQWLTFCIVSAKDDAIIEGNELLMPYEFWLYKKSWDMLKTFWKAGTRGGKNMMSVLDYERGNDFAVSKTQAGIILDKQDSTPIFPLDDANYDKYLDKIEAAITTPKVKIPSDRDLDVFAAKIEEEADRLSGGGGPRRSARRVSPATDDPEGGDDPDASEAAPATRRPAQSPAAAAGPRRRPAPAPLPEDEGGDPPEDDSNPELAPVPAAKRPAPSAGPRRLPPQAEPEEQEPEPAPARAAAAGPRRRAPEPEPEAGDPEPEPEPEAETPPPRRAAATAAPAPGPRAAAPGPKRASNIPGGDQVEDDPEVLPEEATDAAPPARKTPEESNGEPETPTPVTRRTGLGSQIRDKVKQTAAREGQTTNNAE